MKKEKSNKQMMILSFLGIIFVVAGHTWDQLNLFNNIFPFYSFHMALFVFISGYFYKEKYEDNIFSKNGYIVKKIKTFLVPYFIWNFLYGLLVLFLKNINLIEFGDSFNVKSIFIRPWIDGHQFHLNIPSWFLLSLFLVNIIYLFIKLLLRKLKIYNDYFLLLFFLAVGLICIHFSFATHSDLLIQPLRIGVFLFFYQFGIVYKKHEGIFNFNFWKLLAVLLIQLIIIKIDTNISYEISLMTFHCKYIFTPILCGITAIIFWSMISQILVPYFKDNKYVNYVSSHTKEIMFHHTFWIFAINTLFYLISNILHLSSFDVNLYKHTVWYSYNSGIIQLSLFYTIFCLNMPLVCHIVFEKVKSLKVSNSRKLI